jgi:hypothetical protein
VLGPVESGMATEIGRRLLQARSSDVCSRRVNEALELLRSEIVAAFPPTAGGDLIELNLLSYDVGAQGLVVVGTVGHDAAGGDLEVWVVKTGDGIEGQAYRRREIVLFRRSQAVGVDYYHDLLDSTLEPHTVVMAIPFYYPLTAVGGRRVAVLRIASRSNTSGLLRLEQSGAAGAQALTLSALGWFATKLGSALELGSLAPGPGV